MQTNKRTAVVWCCRTGDQRQRHKTQGCGRWNLTMMRKVDGQVWCKDCKRRTRMNAGKCYQYETKEEAEKAIKKRYLHLPDSYEGGAC